TNCCCSVRSRSSRSSKKFQRAQAINTVRTRARMNRKVKVCGLMSGSKFQLLLSVVGVVFGEKGTLLDRQTLKSIILDGAKRGNARKRNAAPVCNPLSLCFAQAHSI